LKYQKLKEFAGAKLNLSPFFIAEKSKFNEFLDRFSSRQESTPCDPWHPEDYRRYELLGKDLRDFYTLALCGSFIIGMLFYNSIWASLLIWCASASLEKYYGAFLCERRKRLLMDGFRDVLYSLSASLSSGRKFPIALKDAAKSSEVLYGKESIIFKEMEYICKKSEESNVRPEVLLDDFAKRTGIEEAQLFARSALQCMYIGGDMENLCLKSAFLLIDKMEFSKEKDSILSEKKLDMWIMLAMPVITLLFLSTSSGDYIEILYEALAGRVIMTLSLSMMVLACLWCLKILRLEL